MTPAFVVRTTPHVDRLFHRPARRHTDLPDRYAEALPILASDPYNRIPRHRIRKLEGLRQGEGQDRLRLGRWRFRYDIYGQEVALHSCSLRREDTYRQGLAYSSLD